MYFDSFSALLKMGTHGAYVWTAYGIALLAIIVFHVVVRLRHQQLKKRLTVLKTWQKDKS